MSKKKIALVIGKLTSGGAQRVMSTLSNMLIEKYDITIITIHPNHSFYTINPNVRIVNCFEKKITSNNIPLPQIGLYFLITKKIYQIIKAEKISLVISFITNTNVFSIIASKYAKIPCLISERTNPKIAKLSRFWNFVRKITYPLADKVIVQTNLVKVFYEKFLDTKKIVVLPNPISSELTKKIKETERENIVLHVGRLHWVKNQKSIVEAFANLNNEEWQLVILGEGREKENLNSLVNTLGKTNIHILDSEKEIERHYNKSKIFVFNSFYEGFPNALLEAMHFGLAPISTNCESGPSELIDDGTDGFLIEVDNQTQLEQKLDSLVNNPQLVTDMGIKAKKKVDGYRAEKVVKLWDDMIKEYI